MGLTMETFWTGHSKTVIYMGPGMGTAFNRMSVLGKRLDNDMAEDCVRDQVSLKRRKMQREQTKGGKGDK